MNNRRYLKNKRRIVVKIGSSSLTHENTGRLNFSQLEKYVREISDLKNRGKEVILVTSGAIAVGTNALGLKEAPTQIDKEQAVASVGQAVLMMIYQKIFREYNQIAGQILITKDLLEHSIRRKNAQNTIEALLEMNVIPIVNENDTVATEEIVYGDNDTLSAIVAELINADLLILLSDINGLYNKDPNLSKDARLISTVENISEEIENMGSDTSTGIGTGGMITKISAAKIATENGIDMIIAKATQKYILERIIGGEEIGTLFIAKQ